MIYTLGDSTELQVTVAYLVSVNYREEKLIMQEPANINSEINETKPVRVSKAYYEWLRKEAFDKNDTIRNLTDKILYEFIHNKEREFHV